MAVPVHFTAVVVASSLHIALLDWELVVGTSRARGFNGEYVVILRNGTKLTLSRGYREKLQDRLGKPL